MYSIKYDNLPAFFKFLSKIMPLKLPIRQDGVLNFADWFEGCNFEFEKSDKRTVSKTVSSPKNFFLPVAEQLYSSKITQNDIHITPAVKSELPFILFGVRPCDYKGLEKIDRFFLAEPIDIFYKARRDASIIITMACQEASATCFCDSLDINPTTPSGDIFTFTKSDKLFWEAITEKGHELTRNLTEFLTEDKEKPSEVEKDEKYKAAFEARKTKPTLEQFNDASWDELTCLTCGTCTFICPTCYCYDISCFDAGNCVKNQRTWDSCMYEDHAKMAHGHPRPTQKERIRQRFMHKLVYQFQETGEVGCVGCGRCTLHCPVNLSILKVV